jgi:hypothetical protein
VRLDERFTCASAMIVIGQYLTQVA